MGGWTAIYLLDVTLGNGEIPRKLCKSMKSFQWAVNEAIAQEQILNSSRLSFNHLLF